MKALLLKNYKELELVDLPKPEPGPNDVRVRVKACGICGSDVHGWDGSTGRRIPPLVMGHEAAGVIDAMGANVKGMKEGDRVTFDSTVSCGHCFFCTQGAINLCDNRQVLGVACQEFSRNGAFAEYVLVPQNIMYKLPDSLPFENAALIEAVSIAVHAVNITPKKLGGTAVVVGTGMIGLLIVQAVKLAGYTRVIAVDLDDAKLGVATRIRCDGDVESEECGRSEGGRGVDRRTWGGCRAGGSRSRGADQIRHTKRSEGWRGNTGWKRQPYGGDSAASSGEPADPFAGFVRIERRVPGVHRPDEPGADSSSPDYQRQSAA